MARLRYMNWTQYGSCVTRLAALVLSQDEKFDLVIGIARGGVPVAMAVADQLGTKIEFLNVKSYTAVGKRARPKILSTITEEIAGMRVLIVDDLVDEGDTMETVARFLGSQKPRAIRTAVLFTKPWSRFSPDFFLETVEDWIVFPYERGEVKRSMIDELRVGRTAHR